jgi:DNA polymerase-3 subunit delta
MASTVNALQIESVLKQQAPAPLYLIVGEEDLLRDHALAALKIVILVEGG